MSGPKVVQIVSREEMEFIKTSQLTRLRTAINSLKEFLDNHDLSEKELVDNLEHRFEQYNSLDASDYQRFQQEINAQVDFIREQEKLIENKLIDALLLQKQHKKRLQDACHALLIHFEQKKLIVPVELLQWSSHFQADDTEALEKIVNQSFDLLFQHQQEIQEELCQEQIAIQGRLSSDNKPESYHAWLTRQNVKEKSPNEQRLDRMITELQLLEINQSVLEGFIDRANLLVAEKNDSRQKLLIDSLTLDIVEYLRTHREIRACLQKTQELVTEISLLQNDCEDKRFQYLKLASDNTELQTLHKLITAGKNLRDELFESYSEETRRSAVLKGLHALGYSAEENLSAAWVENGRLVVSKDRESDYGIELAASSGLERCQIRVVANISSRGMRSESEDLAQEETWCEDFSQLKEELAEEGAKLNIERILKSGAQALHEVDFETEKWTLQNSNRVSRNRFLE